MTRTKTRPNALPTEHITEHITKGAGEAGDGGDAARGAFVRRLAWGLWRQTGALCVGLTLLVMVWQLGRAAERASLVALGFEAWVGLLPGVGVGLLVLTWPAAAMLATVTAIGRLRDDGDLLGWRALGWGLGSLLRAWRGFGVGLVLGLVGLVGWVGPWALAHSREVVAQAVRASLREIPEGQRRSLPDQTWVWRGFGDAVGVWKQAHGEAWVLEIPVQQGEVRLWWLSEHAGMVQAQRLWVGTQDLSSLASVSVAGGSVTGLIPELETQTIAALWRRGRDLGDGLAWGQVSKRLTLAGGALSLLVLVALLALRGGVWGGVWAGFGGALLLHGWARGAELLTRSLGVLGVGLAVGVVVGVWVGVGVGCRRFAARW